ncbi:ABC transporter substrate-binding protein [Firmicutes bacterium AM10-47]|jgi:ribose transport system substrate-binding protein|nr:LacI family transcriptional regulator [Firmicutes bacterium AM10-47]
MKRAVAVLLCAVLATGSITSCQSKKSETAASSSVKEEKETKTDKDNENEKDDTSKNDSKGAENTENQENVSTDIKTDTKSEGDESENTDAENDDMKDDLTMQKLRENGSSIDYTSLEEINLEAGSHIAVVVKSTKNGFWTSVKRGMDAAVADLNEKLGYKGDDKIKLTFEGPSDETDVEDQINIIDAVLGENPDVLCLSAIDMDSCQAQLEAAEENGIPVIVLDSGVKTGNVNATCVVDNYQAGVQAAVKLADTIGGSGKIAVMTHVESAQNCQEREQGFTETIAEKYPDIEIVNISHQNEETSVSEMAESVLKLFPDVKGYFCTNENVSGDVLDAISASGKEVAVVGIDAGKKQKDAIKSGKEVGVLVQNAYGMGYATVVAAARAVLGMENDESINPGMEWIDSENISDERYANYLYD